MQFAQICDLVETDAATGPVEFSQWTGNWVNSNPDTTGIGRLVISETNGNFFLEVQAIGPDALIDWGKTAINTLAASPSSRAGAGFTCLYDFGFATTRLQGMIVKGLIVLAQFHRFKDESGRMDYFLREYFAMDHGRY
jgi:hypothetical protein